MHEDDKMFVCYYRSWWHFDIWPRKFSGWIAMFLWCVPALGLFLGYDRLTESSISTGQKWGSGAGLLLTLLIWQLAMIRWMKARAKMIKVD
jgi:hypothetical protein